MKYYRGMEQIMFGAIIFAVGMMYLGPDEVKVVAGLLTAIVVVLLLIYLVTRKR